MRLTRGVEFQRVFQQGKRLHAQGLSIRVVQSPCGFPRLGMAIAKKVLRRAHDRNRIRRVVRESFRHFQHELPAVDIVVLCRLEVREMDNNHLFRQLNGLWLRLQQLYSPRSG